MTRSANSDYDFDTVNGWPGRFGDLANLFDRALTPVCRLSGGLAAVFLCLIAVFVLLQIGARLIGHVVPSADEFAGFCLSASTFLGLAYGFNRGVHIRVTLLRDRLDGPYRVWLDRVAVSVALMVVAYLTYFAWVMVIESFVFGDMTDGLVPLPLWLPQTGMVAGISVLCLVVASTCLQVWTFGHANGASLDAASPIAGAGDDR
jgi:TRAP-type C4-dicarboxylate transport system permease small subunit